MKKIIGDHTYESHKSGILVYRHTEEKKSHPVKDNCVFCGSWLFGKRGSFCSGICKSSYEKDMRLIYLERRGECYICGFKTHPVILELHHIDPSNKKYGPAEMISKRIPIQDAIKEFNKCIALCPNCHKLVHLGIEKIDLEK